MSSTTPNQTTVIATNSPDVPQSSTSERRERYQETILLSADWNCWGLVATAYYYVETCLHFVWHTQTLCATFLQGFRPGITYGSLLPLVDFSSA